MESLIESSELLSNSVNLRARARRDGYLFFSGVLPAEPILALRRAMLRVTAEHNLLAEGVDADAAIAREGAFLSEYDRTPEFVSYYQDVQRQRELHAVPHEPKLLGLVEQVIGESAWTHPRHIFHPVFPGHLEHTTPPHQDFDPVRGAEDTWSVWLPLGDCNEVVGGVALAPGSHLTGLRSHTKGETTDADITWATGPMAVGDVLMFHSLMLHKGYDNTTTDRIRMAASFRYQAISQPVDGAAFNVHLGFQQWDDVYAGWPEKEKDPLAYYWRSLELDVQPAYHSGD